MLTTLHITTKGIKILVYLGYLNTQICSGIAEFDVSFGNANSAARTFKRRFVFINKYVKTRLQLTIWICNQPQTAAAMLALHDATVKQS